MVRFLTGPIAKLQMNRLSLDIALTLLHDFLESQHRPMHLLGHGMGGLFGTAVCPCLSFSRQVVNAALGGGVNPMVDWQAHYYAQLEKAAL